MTVKSEQCLGTPQLERITRGNAKTQCVYTTSSCFIARSVRISCECMPSVTTVIRSFVRWHLFHFHFHFLRLGAVIIASTISISTCITFIIIFIFVIIADITVDLTLRVKGVFMIGQKKRHGQWTLDLGTLHICQITLPRELESVRLIQLGSYEVTEIGNLVIFTQQGGT